MSNLRRGVAISSFLTVFLSCFFIEVSTTVWAQGEQLLYGDGSDGDLVVSSTIMVNACTYLTGNEAAGDMNISVSDASGFTVGDEVMIIQMQDGLGNGETGRHEFARIASMAGNGIVLTSGLSHDYYSGTFNVYVSEAAQMIRVPQFASVTIEAGGVVTAPAWDGYSGGIVAFRVADALEVDGTITVVGRGFRGGWEVRSKKTWGVGYRGEGIVGGPGPDDIFTNQNGGGGRRCGMVPLRQLRGRRRLRHGGRARICLRHLLRRGV